jgi:hypothetical protein
MKILPSQRRLLIIILIAILCIAGFSIWKLGMSLVARGGKIKNNIEAKQAFTINAETQTENKNSKATNLYRRDDSKNSLKHEGQVDQVPVGLNSDKRNDKQSKSIVKSNPKDPEEAYYSQFDKEFNKGDPPLNMVGIPEFVPSNAKEYKPTPADQQRVKQIEAEWDPLIAKSILSHKRQRDYVRIDLEGEKETVYVHPDYAERYNEASEELRVINQRSMVPTTKMGFFLTPEKGRTFQDGSKLVYYRRKDGSLIRSVQKTDGTVLRWVIGWTDLTPYDQHLKYRPDRNNIWRDE